jgi:hypothetical protein
MTDKTLSAERLRELRMVANLESDGVTLAPAELLALLDMAYRGRARSRSPWTLPSDPHRPRRRLPSRKEVPIMTTEKLSVERIEELQDKLAGDCIRFDEMVGSRMIDRCYELEAILSLAHSAASGSEWRAIDDVPKDGTIVTLAYDNCRHSFAAYWSQCPRAVGGDAKYPWVTLDETNGVNGMSADAPKYWRHLPPPPTKKELEK